MTVQLQLEDTYISDLTKFLKKCTIVCPHIDVLHYFDTLTFLTALLSCCFVCSTIWIRSPRPFLIELSLRTIQDTMQADTWVNPRCFDLAVRKLTSDAIQRNAGTDFVGSTHMFDLQFHRLAWGLSQTGLGQVERTNLLINNVIVRPLPKYDMLMTPSIVRIYILNNWFVYYLFTINFVYLLQYLLPLYLVDSSYGLLAVNIENRRTLLIDHSNESFLGLEDFHDKELKKEALIVLQEFGSVLQQERPGLNPQLVD